MRRLERSAPSSPAPPERSCHRAADGITWTGTSSGPMGGMLIRDSETLLSPGRMTLLGQYSLDGGTSWNTGYDLSCER